MLKRNKKKEKSSTNSIMKWENFISSTIKNPYLENVDFGPFFEKRHYKWEDIRLVIINYKNGDKRICIFDRYQLQVEADYDGKKNRIYVSADSFTKEPLFYLHNEIVTFMEEFAKKEDNGENDRSLRIQIQKELDILCQHERYAPVRKEAEELSSLYTGIQNHKIDYIVEMNDAIRYLKKKCQKNNQGGFGYEV